MLAIILDPGGYDPKRSWLMRWQDFIVGTLPPSPPLYKVVMGNEGGGEGVSF